MQNDIIISPKLTVAAFGSWYFFVKLSPEKDKSWRSRRKYLLKRYLGMFSEFLGREPILSDLSRETILKFVATIENCKHGRPEARQLLGKLRIQAMQAGVLPNERGTLTSIEPRPRRVRGGSGEGMQKPLPLSEAEGTLWHLCIAKYFKTCIGIRSQTTRYHYTLALREFRRFLGHEPTLADLTEDSVLGWMVAMRSAGGKQNATINSSKHRIIALWEWAARKRLVDEFPTIADLKEPRRTPKAWSQEQLNTLLSACQHQQGLILGVPASLWWTGLHLVLWDCGERISAILALTWSHVNLDGGRLDIPAELRKGQGQDMSYSLHPDTVAVLRSLRAATDKDEIFPWRCTRAYLFMVYTKLLKDAGLPHDRVSKFHRMRRSVASHMAAAGGNATRALAHSSEEVTRRSYLDPSITGTAGPAQILFRPTTEGGAS